MKGLRRITVVLLAVALLLTPFSMLPRATADTAEDAAGKAGEETVLTESTEALAAEGTVSSEEVPAVESTVSSEEAPTTESVPTNPVSGEAQPENTLPDAAPTASPSNGMVIRLAGSDLDVTAICVYGESEDPAFLHGEKWNYKSWSNLMTQNNGVYEITYKGCEGGKDSFFKFALNGDLTVTFGSETGRTNLVSGVPVDAAYNGGTFKLPEFEGIADVTLRLDLTGYDNDTTKGATFLLNVIVEGTELPPTETPVPTMAPTDTPTPTEELTSTPMPTEEPKRTPTEELTSTPMPTNTPIPTLTNTPVPTNTPTPTEEPTPTEGPTATPAPTATPTPVPEVQTVTLNRTTLRMPKGRTFRLKASVSPKDAASRKITWKSSNPKVASVSQSGFLSADAVGTTLITATAPNGVHATCKVTVYTRQVRQFTKNGVYRFSTSTVTQKKLLAKKYIQSNAFKVCGYSNTPVYWITTPGTGHHHLTTSYYEAAAAIARGDKAGRAFYASDTVTSKPVFELVQMTKIRNYRYTTDVRVKNYLVSIGWVNKGIAFYAEPN